MEKQEDTVLVQRAVQGDAAALAQLLAGVQDFVFNLSLRMLGTIQDAEDAAQEILIKVMTNLVSFRQESKFTTWVYRIATNDLLRYKAAELAKRPLSFSVFGADLAAGGTGEALQEFSGVEQELLAEELKLSCTNVMLQCLPPESRCIFILGTMFQVDSRIAGEILGLSPEAYRQRLHRIKKKMGDFLAEYCQHSGTGRCSCKKRLGYAVKQKRLNPATLEYTRMQKTERAQLTACMEEMETLDRQAALFSALPAYRAPDRARFFIEKLLRSPGIRMLKYIKREELQ